MKTTRKILAMVLAMAMIMAMAVSVSAANVTIKNAQSGSKYNFYQILEWDSEKQWYKQSDETIREALSPYFVFNGEYYQGKTDDAKKMTNEVLAVNLLEAIKEKITSTEFTAATTGDQSITLPEGYYLMLSNTNTDDDAIPSLAELNTDGLVIKEKNTSGGLPYLEKTYADDKNGNYSIGDTANFKVVITVEEGSTGYTVHDVATDLDIDTDSIVIKVKTNGTETQVSEDKYTVKTSGLTDGCTFEIELELDTALKAYDTITITYSATVTGSNPSNKASLTGGVGGGDPGTSSYNYGFTLLKTTEDGTTKLEGATFKLYKSYDADTKVYSNEIKLTLEDGAYRPAIGTDEVVDIVAGQVVIKGLAAGTYYLQETNAPVGYQKLTNAVIVTIEKQPDDESKAIIKGAGAGDEDASGTVIVKNAHVDALPETGGIGTTIFYTLGGILVLAAVVLLITKKRMAVK